MLARRRVAACVFVLVLACGEGPKADGEVGSASESGEGESAGESSSSVGESSDASSSDASSSDASSSDASEVDSSETGEQERDYSSDKSKFFGESRCDAAGVLFCEDFEAAAIDGEAWEIQGEAPTLDAARSARGAQSLHVHTEANGLSLLRHTASFPVAENVYWGRMFVWIDALPSAPDWAHWTLVGADGPDLPGEIRVGGQYHAFEARNLFGVGTDGGATGDWTWLDGDPEGAALSVPTQAWVCLEWLHDGQNHVTEFYWDAVEHPSLATSASEHGGNPDAEYLLPTFDSVWVGWWLYQGAPSPDHYDVWIDEVALDGIRIGCIW
ncbi:hypothetical protein ACNOYE_17710 [Nannocystaceae bacterium ST9]